MASPRRSAADEPTLKNRQASSRQAQAAETEAALKAAARRVFARRGYLNTKITDITTEAGRSTGSFYTHFTSKEELLEALAADIFSEASERIVAHGSDHDLSDPAQLREHVATTWYAFKTHLPEIAAVNQAALIDENLARRVNEMRFSRVEIMREHLEQLQQTGFALSGDPALLASAMVSLLEQFCAVWLVRGGDPIGRQLDDDEAITTLTAFILHGITGPARPK